MEQWKTIYETGAMAVVAYVILPLIMSAIKAIDEKMDSWSLADKVGTGEFKISLLNVVGLVLSALTSLVITMLGGSFDVYALLAGTAIIYVTQYGVSKTILDKILTLILHVKNKTFKVSDVTDIIDEVKKDEDSTTADTKDSTDE